MIYSRDQFYQFKLEQSNKLGDLDLATKSIVDAIIEQQDVFRVAHNTQIALMEALRNDMVSRIQDEHAITRSEILQGIRVRTLSSLFTIVSNDATRTQKLLNWNTRLVCQSCEDG